MAETNTNYRSLRTHLIFWHQLLIIVFVAVVCAVTYWYERENHTKAVFQKLEAVAVLKNRALMNWLEDEQHLARHLIHMSNIRGNAIDLLQNPVTANARKALTQQFHHALADIPDLSYMALLGADGSTIVVSSDHNKTEALKESGIEVFTKEAAVQTLQYLSGSLELAIVTPFRAGHAGKHADNLRESREAGPIQGYLYMSLNLDHLHELLYEQAGLGETGETYLLDQSTRILAGAREKAFNAQLMVPQLADTFRKKSGHGVGYNYKSNKVLRYHLWLEPLQLALVAETSWDAAMAPLRWFLLGLLAAALILIGLAYLVAITLAKKIASPIQTVANTAEKISQGDLSLRVPKPDLSELAHLADSFNRMANALQSSFREKELVYQHTKSINQNLRTATSAKNLFLANMSHELRTPLNAIIGYSELLKEEAQDNQLEGLVEDFSRIQIAGQHLLALVNDVLDVSKIEEGKMELYLEEFSLEDFVNSIYSVTQLLVKKNANRFHISLPQQPGSVVADMTRLKQSIINLISNAAKFTRNGDIWLSVRFSERETQAWVEFSVKDTGVGIAEEKQEKIFEQFVQADNSTTKEYGGTGLGLTLARQFVELMGGILTLDSEKGKGAEFIISVPTTPQCALGEVSNSK